MSWLTSTCGASGNDDNDQSMNGRIVLPQGASAPSPRSIRSVDVGFGHIDLCEGRACGDRLGSPPWQSRPIVTFGRTIAPFASLPGHRIHATRMLPHIGDERHIA
jgi:hypothetical protein